MSDEQAVETKTEETQEESKQTQEAPLTLEAVKKMIQSETDRVRTEYSGKLKDREAELEKLQKEKMSEKERAAFELEQQKKANAATAAELAKRELALDKAGVITELEVPKELAPYVMGDSKEQILSSAKALMDTFAVEVAKGVEKRLASNTSKPEMGDKVDIVAFATAEKFGAAARVVDAMPPGPEKEAAYDKLYEAAEKIS